MHSDRKNVVVLGSTGSIGQNALAVVRMMPDRFRVWGLSTHVSCDALVAQSREFSPEWIAATDMEAASQFDWPQYDHTEVDVGGELICERVTHPQVDVIVSAIVGLAGLSSNWAALGAGKTVALANKETLVAAGSLAIARAKRHGALILPVDSEHSAVFQALQAGRLEEVERVVLTASGGPFREKSLEDLQSVTLRETLQHPTWKMGEKITVDSATMMNKALEVIEARWLFGLDPERIRVVVHPQSIVHSLVEFRDGSVIAQLSPPDMKLPIQYALTYPERVAGPAERMRWNEVQQLDFEPPDTERFPALKLGFEVARRGGTCGAVLNAANEAAVAAYLRGKIRFVDIVQACREVLDGHPFIAEPTLEDIIHADQWARQETNSWISTC